MATVTKTTETVSVNVSVLQENLAAAIGIVLRAVESRTVLPVLANILLETTDDGRLALTGGSIERSITTVIGANVQVPIAITLPAKTLAELVSTFSPGKVDLTLNPTLHSVTVRCGGAKSVVRGIAADEYPKAPDDGTNHIFLSGKTLKSLIQKTIYAVTQETNRPILTAIGVRIGETVAFNSGDGYSLALYYQPIPDLNEAVQAELAIPSASLREVARIVSDEDEIEILWNTELTHVTFKTQWTRVFSQLLEGPFPDFTALIKNAYRTSISIATKELLSACQRAAIFAPESARAVTLTIDQDKPDEIRVRSRGAERGSSDDHCAARVTGERLEISCNVRYLVEALGIVSSDMVQIEFNNPSDMIAIHDAATPDWIAIIAPMATPQ